MEVNEKLRINGNSSFDGSTSLTTGFTQDRLAIRSGVSGYSERAGPTSPRLRRAGEAQQREEIAGGGFEVRKRRKKRE